MIASAYECIIHYDAGFLQNRSLR